MLNPGNDRLDYGHILAAPAGYELDFAVGTTYSLDLDALVGASFALGLSEETDSDLMNNPVCLLEALRSIGDKIALFCEGGQIHLPSRTTPLYILLEKVVFSVKTAKRRGIAVYPSFHPKFWLIRYASKDGKDLYRIIVLSRNLTFDRSWDVSFYMDGSVQDRSSDKNQPLCDFLQYLISRMPPDDNGKHKARAIRALIKALPYVAFDTADKAFYDYEFIPNGIKREDGGYYRFEETPLFKDTFHEALIISPFVSGGVIRSFNDRNIWTLIKDARYLLITRETSLARLKPEDVSRFRIFTLRDTVIDGETAISESAEQSKKQDIHAKVYMIRKYADTDLYLGSLNASHNAVYGNVEFMIRLRSRNRYLNMDKLTASLFGNDWNGPDNPFQETDLQHALITEEDDQENALDAIIKNINRSRPTAVATVHDEMWTLNLHFDACETNGFDVRLRPLLSNKTSALASDIAFTGLTVLQLSEFYVASVSDGSKSVDRVLIIPTVGFPENREKEVVTSIVSDKDCFYRYVAFLLGDNSILSMLESKALFGEAKAGMNRQPYNIPALYERMLQTAASAPEKFRGIEYLMKTISEDGIIPEDFRKLYDTFKKAVKLNA